MAETLSLYTKTVGGVPVEYEYGPSWKATKLMIDGGYPTPEKAKEAWMHESLKFECDPPEDAPDFGTTYFDYDPVDDMWRCGECYGPVTSVHKWCPHCGRKRRYK